MNSDLMSNSYNTESEQESSEDELLRRLRSNDERVWLELYPIMKKQSMSVLLGMSIAEEDKKPLNLGLVISNNEIAITTGLDNNIYKRITENYNNIIENNYTSNINVLNNNCEIKENLMEIDYNNYRFINYNNINKVNPNLNLISTRLYNYKCYK